MPLYTSDRLYTVRIGFRITSANFNSTADQQFTKLGTFTSWLPLRLHVANSSASAASAVGGVYTAASKAGTEIIPAATAWTSIAGANQGQAAAHPGGAGANVQTVTPYLSLTTPHGTAVTADCYLAVIIVS